MIDLVALFLLIELIYVIRAWNSAEIRLLIRNQKPQSIGRSIGGSSIDQLINWAACSANSELLGRSVDRSGSVLSRTESTGIDHWIDWPAWIDQPIDPEFTPCTVASRIDQWIDPIAFNRLSSIPIDWGAGFRPRNLVVQFLDHKGCKIWQVHPRLYPLAYDWW